MPLDLTPQKMPYYTIDQNLPLNGQYNYKAQLTQTSTNNPTTTELQNTYGTVTWTRIEPGKYRSTMNNLYQQLKTIVSTQQGAGTNTQINIELHTDYIEIQTWIFELQAGPALATSLMDGLLNKTSIQIQQFP